MTCNHPNLKEKLIQAEQQYQAGVDQLNQMQGQLLQIKGSIVTLQQLIAEQEAEEVASDEGEAPCSAE